MGIVFAMILSIGIKAISAVVEIVIQMLMTNGVGVSEYGSYTFFVSLIEGAYFVLFSGIIKLNTFYLSTPSSSLTDFKKKYIFRFVMPVIAVIVGSFAIMRNPYGVLSGIILLLYYLAFDTSSVFFSRGCQLPALLGEYLFGRIVLLIGVLTTIKLNTASALVLLGLYGLQFVTMIAWFSLHKNKLKPGTEEIKVPIRKLLEYQVSDVANSIISYSTAILQFIFGGAFTAGLAGIIATVKRFTNFISGPTVKIFLPEFSRLYKGGEKDKLVQLFVMIVRIQMVFIGTIGALFIGFPDLFLHLFSPELEQYSNVFTGTAISFLSVAAIGPVIGMLQMTGNEGICTRNQWISIGVMGIVWFVLRHETLFAVYGLCVQAIVEGGLNYFSVCRWLKKNVIPFRDFILLCLPVVILRVLVEVFGWQYSFVALMAGVLLVFAWNAFFAMRDPMIRAAVIGKIKSMRNE